MYVDLHDYCLIIYYKLKSNDASLSLKLRRVIEGCQYGGIVVGGGEEGGGNVEGGPAVVVEPQLKLSHDIN